ncbi:MAG TPA: SRPBCC family protein, partial [Vicinamibacteria bacterium]
MPEQATKSIIVGAGVGEVFEVWSNFENFPHFMKNIKSVEKRPDGSTHWVMDGPLGKSVEWDAETTMFEPNKRIAWHSREGSTIKTSGQVTFV